MTDTTILPDRLALLESGEITLNKGAHESFDEGHCAMEVVAFLAGEGITDAPQCASRVLRAFTISLNDQWGDEDRQRLIPFLPRMVGTADDGQDEARSYLALDWLIRSYAPAWLDLAGLTERAHALRSLRRIVGMDTARAADPVVRSARSDAAATRTAATAAAWAAGEATGATVAGATAAGDAAGYAAGYAARDSAGGAGRAVLGGAGRAVLGDAAWHAAWAAGDAAWEAARDATRDAAENATRAVVRDAVCDSAAAAGAALRPTVEALQESALDLLDRMIDPAQADGSDD